MSEDQDLSNVDVESMKPTDVKNGTQILQAHIQTLYDFNKINPSEKEKLEADVRNLRDKINTLYER